MGKRRLMTKGIAICIKEIGYTLPCDSTPCLFNITSPYITFMLSFIDLEKLSLKYLWNKTNPLHS